MDSFQLEVIEYNIVTDRIIHTDILGKHSLWLLLTFHYELEGIKGRLSADFRLISDEIILVLLTTRYVQSQEVVYFLYW